MTYDEAYTRWALLGDAKALRLNARALTAVLVLFSHYNKAIADFEGIRRAVMEGAPAVPEAEMTGAQKSELASRAEALRARAAEDCGLSDRRLTASEFEAVAEGVIAAGQVTTHLTGEAVVIDAAPWLETLFAHVGPVEPSNT